MSTKYADFVKLTDVTNIVQEMCLPLLTQMKQREEDAINMKNTVTILNMEMKKQRADTRQALLLKSTVIENTKLLKRQEEKHEILEG